MIIWHTVQAGIGRVEIVEAYPSLDAALADMQLLAWEDPGNQSVDYLIDEATGEAVAVAIFGPGLELMVTCADGRRLTFEMPEGYREVRDGRKA